jgi:L-histidine Nalpha-methyltransferase / hercynylcysteine S-oxide synthase
VDNPEMCHDHSEIPDSWPPLTEILDYSDRVRARIVESICSGHAYADRRLGRGLWLAYEHEAMHLETFIYMLLQSERVLPPPGQDIPNFRSLACDARAKRVENQWHRVPASKVKLGLDDPEDDLGPDRYFGWDNERPARNVAVGAFEAQSRPISNGEYAWFMETTHKDTLPASWTTSAETKMSNGVYGINGTNGINGHSKEVLKMASPAFIEGKAVRTVYGLVPLKFALDWPVMASYDELAAYAEWADGRIPTLEEARSLYKYVEENNSVLQKISSKLISAVNG